MAGGDGFRWLLEMVRFSGAKVVGVNSNAYQLEKARRRTAEAGKLGIFTPMYFIHGRKPA